MGLPKPNAGGINKCSNLEPGVVASDRIRTKHARMTEVGPLRTVLDRVVLFDDAPLPGELPRPKPGSTCLWRGSGSGRRDTKATFRRCHVPR